jgi:hypothetical protein
MTAVGSRLWYTLAVRAGRSPSPFIPIRTARRARSDRADVARRLVMNEICIRIQVAPNHANSGVAPPDVPPGEHIAIIRIPIPPIPEKRS